MNLWEGAAVGGLSERMKVTRVKQDTQLSHGSKHLLRSAGLMEAKSFCTKEWLTSLSLAACVPSVSAVVVAWMD